MRFVFYLAVASFALATPLTGVEVKKKELHFRFVGSISGNQQKMQDIALIRDESSERTLVLRTGERFGIGSQYLLKAIGEKHVVVVKGDTEMRFDYAPWDTPAEDKSENSWQHETAIESEENQAQEEVQLEERAMSQAHYSALYLRYLNRILSKPPNEDQSADEKNDAPEIDEE